MVSIDPGGMAAKAGLAVGDRVVSYAAPPGGSPLPFTSCLDVAGAELELSPRGPVAVQLVRQGRRVELILPLGDWLFEVAPGTDGSPAARACEGLAAATKAYVDNQPEAEERAYDEAAAAAAELADPMAVALARHRQGLARLYRDRFDGAEQAMKEALDLRLKAAPESLTLAVSWHGLGRLEQARGRYDESDRAFEEARRLRARFSPESLDLYWTMTNLGINAYQRHDLDNAERYYSEARALAERIAPGSREVAGMESNLGLLARERGHLDEAQMRLTAARAIFERVEPGGEMAARNLVSLAVVAMDRGDLSEAESAHHEALLFFERQAPESLVLASIYEDLGKIARDRADYAQAEALVRRALDLRRKLGAGPQFDAQGLSVLAWILFKLGKLEEADRAAASVLTLTRTSLAPGAEAVRTAAVAAALHTRAEVAAARGDVRAAIPLMERTLAWIREFVPGSLRQAIALETIGGFLSRAGRTVRAEVAFEQSIALFQHLAPDSFQLANAWGGFGRHLERVGRQGEAVVAYRKGIEALEAQISRLGGGDDALANFEQEYAYLYRRLVALEVVLGHPQEALEVLERSRGRGLLAELLARDIELGEELSPELRAELREVGRAYDRTQRQLAEGEQARSEGWRSNLFAELATLRSRRAALAARVATLSPRYAALRFPASPNLEELRHHLEAGTVWLSYMVGEHESFLFILRSASDEPVTEKSLRVVALATSRSALAGDVAVFRSLILRGMQEPNDRAALSAAGRRLFQLLVAPAGEELRTAERVLISADGPLHLLPFGALVLPGSALRYLIEEKPLFSVLSLSLYAELARSSQGAWAGTEAFAFVDPLLETSTGSPSTGTSVLERYRSGLLPLPGARAEAAALSALFGRNVRVLAGQEAREGAVTKLPHSAGFVHFACHALIDADSPLDSGLALASGAADAKGEENGLLQGWEIFSRVRLNTPLVTLSACETGLGRDGGGEGVIGLARAFQFAGARSVLASLWQVSDESTAALMAHFYRSWAAGKSRALALAEAQRALIQAGGPAGHPYRWAAFTINGDSR